MSHLNYLPFNRVKTQLCEKNQLDSILIYSIYSERSERVEKYVIKVLPLNPYLPPVRG